MTFASDTSVNVERSQGEIERVLARYGATHFMRGWAGDQASIAFTIANRSIRFMLPLPSRDDEQFAATPTGRRRRNPAASLQAWEQACRSRWRALLLVIRAKLEAVETGISTIEDEFLAWTIIPGGRGRTVGEQIRPLIEEMVQTGKAVPLQLGFSGGGA